MDSDYDWFVNADLSEFSGKWVAILNKKVVSSNADARKVAEDIKSKYPDSKPLIAKVSSETMLL
jgi:hypothetical protein